MDLTECVRILQERRITRDNQADENAACPCCTTAGAVYCSPSSQRDAENQQLGASSGESLAGQSLVSLIDVFLHIQESRVKKYREYNEMLEDILQSGSLDMYPSLCSQMTTMFSRLSESALRVKAELQQRESSSLLDIVQRIQGAEKDKLMHVAALHLDRMQQHLPTLQQLSGECPVQQKYLQDRVAEIEGIIGELVQELQAWKTESLEDT